MLKINTYSIKGIKLEALSLPKDFSEKVNLTLLTQAIRVYEERSHPGLVKVKTRAEVDRTKKKWYRQKGTGGARHGARSAPIFVGGGAAHGPRPIRRELVLPEKMKRKALKVALSVKIENKEIMAVDGLSKITKTKDIKSFVAKLRKEFPNLKKISFVLSEVNLEIRKALQNIQNVDILAYKDLNAYLVFYGGMVVLYKEIFKKIK